MLKAHHRDWERDFDRKMGSIATVESKIDALLKNDGTMRRRIQELSGLMRDVRG
jgi:hypothetical protein